MKNKTVIVTGCCGFIGHHLVRELKKRGAYVIGIDDLSNGDEKYSLAVDEFFKGSVTDMTLFYPGTGTIDYIFHLAALPRVPYSIKYPVKTHDANVNGTLNMLELARSVGVKKFVYSSSSSVYGEQEDQPVTEDMKTNPMSPYAVQKLAGELYAENYREVYGLPTASLRYFNVFGEDQDGSHPYATVVAKFLDLKKTGKPLTIHGDGEQTRDMTYVGDVVEANIVAAESEAVGVFNIAGSVAHSVNGVAKMVGGPTVSQPPRGNEPRHMWADVTKAKKVLGWEPKTKLQTWINTQ